MERRVSFWATSRERRESFLSYPSGFLGRLGALLGRLEALFSTTWDALGTFSRTWWAVLVLIVSKPSWGLIGASGGDLGGLSEAFWVPLRSLLGAS